MSNFGRAASASVTEDIDEESKSNLNREDWIGFGPVRFYIERVESLSIERVPQCRFECHCCAGVAVVALSPLSPWTSM
jgi:hypothetical protein